MTVTSFLLVVLAAGLHAGWNLLAKRAAAAGPAFVLAYSLASFVLYLPWVVWLLLRDGMPSGGWVVACIALSGCIHVVYSLCLQRGYRVADLSVVYPVARGTGPLWATVGAFVLLSETPTPQGLAGAACVIVGIALIATQGRWAMFRPSTAGAGVRWGLLIGALIAAYTVVDAYAVKVLAIAPVVLDWSANAVRLALLSPWALAHRAQVRASLRGHERVALLVGAVAPLSYILVLTALSNGAPLSLVAPLREMSMMVGAMLGIWVLREPAGAWRLGGCAVLCAGVVLLGLS